MPATLPVLAAAAPTLLAKRLTSYHDLPTRKFLTRCHPRMRVFFQWTINPYRGCEFGCKYCYARYTHEFLEIRDPADFENRIYAKQFHPAAFRKELAAVPRAECIAIGTATDPYQPAEARFHVTRRILEVLAEDRGRRISLISKSNLMARDADLLSAIARRNVLNVTFTITTMDTELARLLEPRAPRPDLRIDGLRRLTSRGIAAGVFSSPVLPLLNDSYASLHAVAKAAREAGACSFGGNPLFLKPCSRQVWFPFLEQRFPQVVARYRRHYDHADFLKGDYPRFIQDRIESIRLQLRLGRRFEHYEPPEDPGEPQLRLFP
jgi:DNA repair photolyase